MQSLWFSRKPFWTVGRMLCNVLNPLVRKKKEARNPTKNGPKSGQKVSKIIVDIFLFFLCFFLPFWAIKGQFWDENVTIWHQLWTTFGSIRCHLGVTWGSFWHRSVSFWPHFEACLDHFGLCWTILRSFCRLFMGMFWEVEWKVRKNDAREGKHMQISAKIHQKYIIGQKHGFFGYANTCFA